MQASEKQEVLSPESLAVEWFEAYERESAAEDGDAEAFIARVRDIAETAEIGAVARPALTLFLERLRLADLDRGVEEDQR